MYANLTSSSLRIELPQQVISNGKECAKYDCDSGTFTITIPKANEGENFTGLDMITSLIAVPKLKKKVNLIEEIDTDCTYDDGDEDEETIEWTLEESKGDVIDDKLLSDCKYGFANSKSNVFNSMGDEIALAIDCTDVDKKISRVRRVERINDELQKFDEEYYLACLYEEQESIKRLLDFEPYWHTHSLIQMTEQDLFDLKNLTSRSYILDKTAKRQLLLSLVDILCAYAYEFRVTEGESSSESQWTICKLSATLSWLESDFFNIQDVLTTFTRRSLIYPLHRNFQLSQKVIQDVVEIFKAGRKCILKVLIDIRRILNSGCDARYILNDLYITDYCVWIQNVKESTISKLTESLIHATTQVTKESLDLDLPLLERAAELTIEEQTLDEVISDTSTLKVE